MQLFDAHFHIINFNYPVSENQGYLPPEFTVVDYGDKTQDLNIVGGAIVSGSFQGFDQGYLINALEKLGPNFCGVTQLPFTASDKEILDLKAKGVRGLRFNIKRGGSEDLSKLDYFSRRVYELVNWHTELYIDAKNLSEIQTIVEKLPAVSVDHLGLSEAGLPHLLKLVDKGVRVKATGFGRASLDVDKALQTIYKVNPDALMFGTDLPSTRAERPFNKSDIDKVKTLFDKKAAEKILYHNAQTWYFGDK